MKALGAAGIVTELTFPHWLGKASCEHASIDVIFSSGNGIAQVDDAWFENAAAGPVLGVEVRVCQRTLLSREQYLTDVGVWGFEDARLTVEGSMTVDEVAHWTRAIEDGG